MGRGKIEIKRIENANNRVVTFSKRRNGLLKKAKEITVLCDAKVALIIFASNGKMTDYCCPSMDLGAMLNQYQKLSGKKLWDAKHENLSNEIDRIKKENDSLQLELRHLKGEDIQSLNLKNVMAVEQAIEHGLDKVRDHQSEFLMTKRRNEKMMEEEHRQLSFQLQQQEMAIASNARGMMMRDHDGQFGYRVQPIQPNLQEKIMSLGSSSHLLSHLSILLIFSSIHIQTSSSHSPIKASYSFICIFWHCSSTRGFQFCSYKRNEAASSFKRRYREKEEEEDMTIKPVVRISDGNLIIKNRTILTGLPDNVITTSASDSGPVEGVFIGAVFDKEESNHIVPIGTLRNSRFMSCFRFKLWWMAQRMGKRGRDIPYETQFLLVESNDGSHLEPDGVNGVENNQKLYTVFLPLIEGSFRSCLQGNVNDEVELCLESGDVSTKRSSFTHSLYIHAGTDPFKTITDAIRTVKSHLKSFRQRHEKKLPGIVDYFGWCTWDAFYQEVTQEGVEAGLQSLAAGGTPPKFVIIDDGWQSVERDDDKTEQSVFRLTGIKENEKFQKKDDPKLGINNIVKIAKEKHGLKYVYVWHAITGYWGGVRPGQYGSVMKYPMVSKGVVQNEPTWKTDVMAVQGLGLVDPKKVYKFYNELHSYLAAAGVDGVKVDVQCVLETLGDGLGGRVELTHQFHQALDSSVSKNFPDNGCIACMSHNTDALYCSKQAAVIRASDDFYPRDPVSHTIHIASVAYNSVFLGEFMLPDWDMFHSVHPAAEYHASARAISGGPIYVSDAPGKHNFELLRKLVLPDGSILRARLPGRPTRDCLFSDPARDGVSLLKIWNMNKYTGVLGVYNCQGAAWSSEERKNIFHQTKTDCITGSFRGRDVHLISEASTDPTIWNGDCVVYSQSRGELSVMPYNVSLPISLKIREHEIFTVSPIHHLATNGVSFAAIGLVNMYNSGGAIEGLRYEADEMKVVMEVKGCGKFGAYSSVKPKRCIVESNEIAFEYNSSSGLVTFELDNMPTGTKQLHLIEVEL